MDELLERLEGMERSELLDVWAEHICTEIPKTRAVDMFRRRVAWELQEELHGGLDASTKRRLRELASSFEKDVNHAPTAQSSLQSGTTLTREWKGKLHTVQVRASGFIYKGNRYKGLSKIAREITGTRWSGPLFFGLRKSSQKAKVAS
mgnify:CR=1 FL=1